MLKIMISLEQQENHQMSQMVKIDTSESTFAERQMTAVMLTLMESINDDDMHTYLQENYSSVIKRHLLKLESAHRELGINGPGNDDSTPSISPKQFMEMLQSGNLPDEFIDFMEKTAGKSFEEIQKDMSTPDIQAYIEEIEEKFNNGISPVEILRDLLDEDEDDDTIKPGNKSKQSFKGDVI